MNGRVVQLDLAVHKVADVLLPWFVNGTLEGDELVLVQNHLGRCGSCQREVEWLRELHAACVAGEADPEASRALGQLRRKLEDGRGKRGAVAAMRDLASRVQPWSRWVIAAELSIIIVLGAWWLPALDGPALYRTLAASNSAAQASTNLVVVFDPATTEADFSRILRDAGARIVDGPTETNAYVLAVPAQREAQALQALRAQRAAVLVEQLGAHGSR